MAQREGAEAPVASNKGSHQAAHNRDRERPLGIGADSARQRRRQQGETGQHGHHDRPEPLHRAIDGSIQNRVSAGPELVEVLQHDHARLHCHFEQRQEIRLKVGDRIPLTV
jgi:hypothetical protein